MICPIMKDTIFLSVPSEPATEADAQVGRNLLDTLTANRMRCVGMAANMIGVRKRIIVFSVGPMNVLMYNPEYVTRKEAFQAQEGCLSLTGERPCTRYREITVRYQDAAFKPRTQTYTGWTAQIIQHEMDHLEGIII